MASTASQIITYARNLLTTDGSSTSHPALQDPTMLAFLSDANLEWARAFRRGGGTQPLVFLREGGFDLVGDTALAEDVTTAETDWDLDDASSLDSSGALVIWDGNMPDIVSYTSKASNTLSGVSGAGFAHEDGDGVQKLYKLTGLTSFARLRRAEAYGDGVQVNGVPHFFMEGPPDPQHFSIYDDGTDKWLWLPRGSTGSCSVLYEKASTTIDETTDTVDVPPEFDFFLIWRLVQRGRSARKDDPNSVIEAKAEGDRMLLQALKDRNIGRRVAVRPLMSFGYDYDPSPFQS